MSQSALKNSIDLTDRDINIFIKVCLCDGLFSYQIRNRFWGQNSHPKAYNRRLAQLISAGYLRARPMASMTGQGSGQRFITNGPASFPFLRQRLGLTTHDIRRLHHSTVLPDWRHDAQVRDVRLMAEAAAEAHPTVASLDWTNESAFKREPIKVDLAGMDVPGGLGVVNLEPDGAFSLELVIGKPKQHYLEVDRDTERWGAIVNRICAYCRLVGNAKTPVLWIVPTQKRAGQLSASILELATRLKVPPSVFAFTTFDHLSEQHILTAPIWQVVGVAGKKSLLPSSLLTGLIAFDEPIFQLDQEGAVA